MPRDPELGQLAQTFKALMVQRDQMKADGATPAELDAVMEKSLRFAWPETREWKYLCKECSDFGLVMSTCPGDATCGRPRAHLAHDYGTPCWCSQGLRYRDKPKADAADTAARTPKPKAFTKWGR